CGYHQRRYLNMSNDRNTSEISTRREYMKYGGAVIGGGLLAGCTGSNNSGGGGINGTNSGGGDATTGGGANSSNDSGGGNGTTEGGNSYSVTMAPMGEVEFENPPKSVFTVLLHHADMVLAL